MVGKAVGHFANAQMVVIKRLRVSLSGAAVVDHDVAPAAFLNGRLVDLTPDTRRKILPSGKPSTGRRRLKAAFFFYAGFFDRNSGRSRCAAVGKHPRRGR